MLLGELALEEVEDVARKPGILRRARRRQEDVVPLVDAGRGEQQMSADDRRGEQHRGKPARRKRCDRPGEDRDPGRNENEIVRQVADRKADRGDRKRQHGDLAEDRPGRAR
jgi:hypothetical protein